MVKISAGSYDLNKWLHGGYEEDIVTVIYGGPGSGKTNFCLLAAVSQAKKGNKVIYFDTEGGFSVERVKQIVGKVNGGKSDKENVEEVLKNILLLNPTNFSEQKKDFDKLAKNLKDEATLIIVDSMTLHYRLDLADAREKSNESSGDVENSGNWGTSSPESPMDMSRCLRHLEHAQEPRVLDISKRSNPINRNIHIQKTNSELARQIGILGEIARKRNIPVIVTNQIYNWENGTKMVGGDILKYWGKCIIELVNDGGKRIAYLKKHRSLPEKSLSFQIYDGGIRKKGWI